MTKRPLLTCRELIDFIAAYVDGALSSLESERFDEHLRVCPACVDYLASYRETLRATSAVARSEEPVPDSVPEDLVRAILASRGVRGR